MGVSRVKPKMLDRFVGCLLGLACGDALGAPVEDWNRETIRSSLGFIRDYQTTILGRGIITDDTQMAILLCESIIQNEHFDASHYAYVIGEWMRRIDEGEEPARGVGKTVSLAGRRLYKGTYWKRSGEFSAGNAPVVRVPPLALFMCGKSEDELIRNAEDSAVPTHIDPLAISATQVFALTVSRLLKEDPESFNAIEFAQKLTEAARAINPHVADGLEILAPKLAGRNVEEIAFVVPGGPKEMMYFDRTVFLDEDTREIAAMGNGKFVLQSLPAALFCFLAHPCDPESAVCCAVNSGGDADTIGAMTGALAGAFNGAQAIPGRWLSELEKKDYLIDLSNMLYDLATEGHTTREVGGWRVVL
jgi:ADP-ribosyl-[dinitrogen reductase] hydrolase